MLFILITIVIGTAKWAVYTSLLWIMIKIQKMQYNWLGLLGSSALATVLGYIPVVGPYVAWAVLVLCLWKVTHADIAPDVLFTVSIAGALMFCVNLFVIGALMGNLGMAGALSDFDNEMDDTDGSELVDASESDDYDPDDDVETTNALVKSVAPIAVVPHSSPKIPVTTPLPVKASPAIATVKPAALIDAGHIRNASSLPAQISLKGVAVHSKQRTAMISYGKEIHTVAIGDVFSVPSPKGTLLLSCQEITQQEVILALDQGERVRLTFQ